MAPSLSAREPLEVGEDLVGVQAARDEALDRLFLTERGDHRPVSPHAVGLEVAPEELRLLLELGQEPGARLVEQAPGPGSVLVGQRQRRIEVAGGPRVLVDEGPAQHDEMVRGVEPGAAVALALDRPKVPVEADDWALRGAEAGR